MKEYLEQRQDYVLLNTLTFGDMFSTENIKEQIQGIRFKKTSVTNNFNTSILFLETQLDNVLAASKSLDIIEARFDAVQSSMNFILKSRLEVAEGTKGISIVDLDKGTFKDLVYDIDLKGITFSKEIGSNSNARGAIGGGGSVVTLNNVLLLNEGGDIDDDDGFDALLLTEE